MEYHYRFYHCKEGSLMPLNLIRSETQFQVTQKRFREPIFNVLFLWDNIWHWLGFHHGSWIIMSDIRDLCQGLVSTWSWDLVKKSIASLEVTRASSRDSKMDVACGRIRKSWNSLGPSGTCVSLGLMWCVTVPKALTSRLLVPCGRAGALAAESCMWTRPRIQRSWRSCE